MITVNRTDMNISLLLRDIPLCIGVVTLTGIWVFYVVFLVAYPELLNISDDMFFINMWYAICAVGTTLVAYIETAKHLKEQEKPDTTPHFAYRTCKRRSPVLGSQRAWCRG